MHTKMTLHDAARWLQDRYSRRPVWPDRFAGAYLGMGGRDPVFTGPEHCALVIGPPRSGKTSSVIIPAALCWPGPVVTTSTKAETFRITHPARGRYGTTWVFDPTGTTTLPPGARPLLWSPISGCSDWQTAIDRAWMLTNTARPNPSGDGAHWTERASALLAPLLHAAALSGTNMTGLLTWLHGRDTIPILDAINDNEGSAVAHHLLGSIGRTDEREQSGIWSTADSILANYRNPTTLHGADHPNFDPAGFPQSWDSVHIVVPGGRAAQHAPAVCALLDDIRQHTLRTAHRQPMLWALDELANACPLPNLPGIIADTGSQGILVVACLQDLSQARRHWGTEADGLLTLFTTTLLLPGVADTTTLEIVTKLAGLVDKPHRSVTRIGWALGPRHTTRTTRQEPLLPENVVANGRPGLALHLRGTRPSWLRLTPWHSTEWMAHHLRGGQ